MLICPANFEMRIIANSINQWGYRICWHRTLQLLVANTCAILSAYFKNVYWCSYYCFEPIAIYFKMFCNLCVVGYIRATNSATFSASVLVGLVFTKKIAQSCKRVDTTRKHTDTPTHGTRDRRQYAQSLSDYTLTLTY